MNKQKIHILTGVFYPQLHPRAFRAYELAKEFAAQGHIVDVTILKTVKDFDYIKLKNDIGLNSLNSLNLYEVLIGSLKFSKTNSRNKFILFLDKLYRKSMIYLIDGNLIRYSIKISKLIKIQDDHDLFISSSTPFMNHLGTALYRNKNKNRNKNTVFVADSGDPFFYSKQTKRALYFKWVERWVYKNFDYLTIPTELAISAYNKLLPESKIKIIPQAFNFNDTPICKQFNNKFVTFAYAGVFYDDIRNPIFFLEYLSELNLNFKFRLFIRHKDPNIDIMLDKYKKILGNKIELNYGFNRKDLIFELSKSDFLINIDNLTKTQLPSKLIDYGITKRPIFSCNKYKFDKKVFNQYCKYDYSSNEEIDISPYNVSTVVQKFIDLKK